jgi:uncharacterized protein DUF6265
MKMPMKPAPLSPNARRCRRALAIAVLGAAPAALLAAMAVAAQPAPAAPPGAGAPAATPAPASAATTAPASAVTPPPASAAAPAPAPAATTSSGSATGTAASADPLAALAWLQGCWRGTVNQREFREQWLPPAGGMMIGAGHTVMQGRTQDFEYLRIEVRPEGMRYVTVTSGEKEAVFRFDGQTRDDLNPADIFTFANTADAYPQRIVYRHGGEGWLYAQVEGSISGAPRNVTYPMRHVDCETGEVLHK